MPVDSGDGDSERREAFNILGNTTNVMNSLLPVFRLHVYGNRRQALEYEAKETINDQTSKPAEQDSRICGMVWCDVMW
jgi:hypothetical protein